ncbi:MAG: sensor histidine kinase [Nonlabens sp.]
MGKHLLVSCVLLLLAFSWSSYSQFVYRDIDSLANVGKYEQALNRIRAFESNTRYSKAYSNYLAAIVDLEASAPMEQVYAQLLEAKKTVPSDSLALLFKINDELIYTQFSAINDPIAPEVLIEENRRIAMLTRDIRQQLQVNYYTAARVDVDSKSSIIEAIAALKKSLLLIENNMDYTSWNTTINNNLGVSYNHLKMGDSALFYLKRGYTKPRDTYDSLVTAALFQNTALAHRYARTYDSSVVYYDKALKFNKALGENISPSFYSYYAQALSLDNQLKKATNYYEKSIQLADSLQLVEQDRNIKELQEQYESAEKDKEILRQEAGNERKRATIIALVAAVGLIAITAFFIYKNQRKRVLLARQQEKLAVQETDQILKEQVLKTIDAMISGQELERQKLASELHDNLGSSLTTLRLYLDGLESTVQDPRALELLSRTEKVVDATYDTVRNMSHERGNSILSERGLVSSLGSLAAHISNSGKVELEVIHNSNDLKLSNTTELAIFRTIQELVTNIVKHADASEATINITAYKEHLDFLIEDNGKGFIPASITAKTNSLGLKSIEKRVENLGGSLEIDSAPGSGTSIHLEIPIV